MTAAVMAAAVSCDKYDDSVVLDRLDKVEDKVLTLEQKVQANEDAILKLKNAETNGLSVEVQAIENGYKLVFSNGETATIYNGAKGDTGAQGPAGPQGPQGEAGAAGEGGISDFNIQETAEAYVFTYNGQTYTIAKTAAGLGLSVDADLLAIIPGATVQLPYTLTGADATTRVLVEASGYTAVVKDGYVEITAPETLPADGYVIIKAIKNSDASYKALYISFEEGVLSFVADAEEVQNIGGEVNIDITTNLDYEVIIPEAVQTWIHIKPESKAVATERVTLTVDANTGVRRSATITIKPALGESHTIAILQYGEEEAVFIDIDLATVASFNLAGSALTEAVAMTQTVENADVFAWYGDLKAGYIYLEMLNAENGSLGAIVPAEGTAINPAVASDFKQNFMELTGTENWVVPADGKYRVVFNRETSKITIYDEANDLQPLTVNFIYGNTTGWELTKTLLPGTYYIRNNTGWDSWTGKPFSFAASVADPQVLYFDYNGTNAISIPEGKNICIKTGTELAHGFTVVTEGTGTGNNDPTATKGMNFASKIYSFVPEGDVDTPIKLGEWLPMVQKVSNKSWQFEGGKITLTKVVIDLRNNRVWFE